MKCADFLKIALMPVRHRLVHGRCAKPGSEIEFERDLPAGMRYAF
jgi:hypothetical protein